jgi:hypothetical protein
MVEKDMANINSSLDEILVELGDSFDADIASSNRKIVRSTANKIWLMLRAFSRGLYGLYQVVAALKYRFDPLYCTDDELDSTMRITGTTRRPGKVSLLTVTIWNEHPTLEKVLPIDTYYYASANGTMFTLLAQEDIVIQPNSFMKRDFHSSKGDNFYIGAYPVSDNSNITITNLSGNPIDENIYFECADNSSQLGRGEETLFEARQRILTDNQRQEVLRILEERLSEQPNIHECTIIGNNTLAPIDSSYLNDDGLTYVKIMPQSVLVIMTGSPTEEFALQFLTLCPFITTPSLGVADRGVSYYDSAIYLNGRFPVHYIPHRIEYFDIIIQYGYSSRQISSNTIEAALTELILDFKAATKFREVISTEDFMRVLSAYQNASVRILSISFIYKGQNVNFMQFDKTQIARLGEISYQQVSLWT